MPNQTLPVGQAAYMPGTEGFTMVCFKAADVPAGTNLYTLPPMDEDADIYLIARVFAQFREDACIHGNDRVDGAFIKAARRLMGAAQGAPKPPNYSKEVKWPEGYCLDPNGHMCAPQGAHEHWSFGYDMGYAEALALRTTVVRDALAKIKAVPSSHVASALTVDQVSAVKRAVSVFEDVMGDIADWEDDSLSIAVAGAMTDLRALLASTGAKP